MKLSSLRKAGLPTFLFFCSVTVPGASICPVAAEEPVALREFSGTLIKTVNGKKYQAQVFAKGDRLRLEYKYAIRTERGYAAIEIIRLDQAETWYVLAQQKELLVAPIDPDDVRARPFVRQRDRDRHADGVGDALAQRAGRGFDSRSPAIFGMSGTLTVKLTKAFNIV